MVDSVFDHICNSPEHVEFRLRVSIVEIYQEKIRDLLDVSKVDLKIREKKDKGIYIEDVTEKYVSEDNEVYNLMAAGKSSLSLLLLLILLLLLVITTVISYYYCYQLLLTTYYYQLLVITYYLLLTTYYYQLLLLIIITYYYRELEQSYWCYKHECWEQQISFSIYSDNKHDQHK